MLPSPRDTGSFWSWREAMYRVADGLTPESIGAISRRAFEELRRAGVVAVGEFHYVQHQPDGTAYADRLAMSQALVDAASETGIGLTLLPVLYERAGFTQPALRPDQRRFHLDADGVWAVQQAVQAQSHARLNAGVAIHSRML